MIRPKRVIIALMLLLLASPVLSVDRVRADEKPLGKSSASSPTQQKVTERDRRALDVFIRDLQGYDLYIERRLPSRLQIVVNPETMRVDDEAITSWKKRVPLRRSEDLWADFKKRNTERVPLKDVKLSTERLLLRNISELTGSNWGERFHKAYPQAKGYYLLSLPGYSRDGKRAVMTYYEAIPGEQYMTENAGLIVLTKVKGRWRVTKRYHQTGE